MSELEQFHKAYNFFKEKFNSWIKCQQILIAIETRMLFIAGVIALQERNPQSKVRPLRKFGAAFQPCIKRVRGQMQLH